MNWIELHTDTISSEQLSFLDGAQIVSLCAKAGCAAVACTDRNSILSYLPMEREAARRGIQLIYGVTLDCADSDDRYAVTLLAQNEAGRRNIFALMRLLDENSFPFGRCVTWQQIEDHRTGLLLGASAVDGQLIRAIQLRRGSRYLKRIVMRYDYIEFPLEPYDTATQLLQFSREIAVPLCAVQSARLAPDPSDAAIQAFQALCYDTGTGEKPAQYLSPEKLIRQFRALYVLPGEQQGLEQALVQGQKQILEQISPLKPLRDLLNENAEVAEQNRQKELRAQAEEALFRKYGKHPEDAIAKRFYWELEWVEHLNMAGQILLMQEIAGSVRELGSRLSIAGPWNSSFLLYLLGITELNPLPPELDPQGFDLCPASLLETEKPLLSAEMRLPAECISAVREKVKQKYGTLALTISRAMRESRPEEELQSLIDQYFKDCCSPETAEALRANGEFYFKVMHHSGGIRVNPTISWLYLLPKAANPSELPLTLNQPDGLLRMISSGLNSLDNIPRVLLLGSSAQSMLARCEACTGVDLQKIPLDDDTVYTALGEAYRCGETETPVAAACELLGSGVNHDCTDLFTSMVFSDLHSLIRFMSVCHGSGLWEDNQESLVQSGVLCPAQLITCREDVYRYLLDHGAAASEASSFMELAWRGKMNRLTTSQTELLQKYQVEDWFVQVCQKIQYLFPEGHSAEYAVSLVRLVWYVLHYPQTASMVLDERASYRV